MIELRCPDCGKWIIAPVKQLREIEVCRCDDKHVARAVDVKTDIWKNCSPKEYIQMFVDFEERKNTPVGTHEIPKHSPVLENEEQIKIKFRRFLKALLP